MEGSLVDFYNQLIQHSWDKHTVEAIQHSLDQSLFNVEVTCKCTG